MRPTKIDGPAMIFNNIKNHKDARVVIGLLASRERVARLMGCKKEELGKLLCRAALNPIEPVVSEEKAPCQEVIHKVTDPDFDLFKLFPAPTNTPMDAGPYITMGMCYATHPDTGCSDVTIHRMCIQSKDELSIFLQPGSRHIGVMAERATELGQPLPISISIGVDPAIEVGSCFEPPTTPLGYNELSIAGAIRKTPVVLAPCVSIKENAIANAEYVIEGEIQPGIRVVEDQNTHTGYAMPEFPGYNGLASHECWLIKVKAVTHRKNPIMQTVIGPSEEHVNLAGIPTEASIYNMLEKALPGKVTNVYAHPSGGGKYMAVLQCRKTVHTDEGKQRQAALLAFSAFPELKHVILVDEDVDIFDTRDVLWAMNTRFQGDRDIITIPGRKPGNASSIDRRSRMNSLSYGPFRVSFPTLRMISWISRFWLPLWSPEIPIPKRIFSGPSISRTGRNFPERITAAGSNMSDRKRSRTTKMQFRSYKEPLGSLLRSAIKCTFPGWNLSANTKRKAYYEKRKTNSQH